MTPVVILRIVWVLLFISDVAMCGIILFAVWINREMTLTMRRMWMKYTAQGAFSFAVMLYVLVERAPLLNYHSGWSSEVWLVIILSSAFLRAASGWMFVLHIVGWIDRSYVPPPRHKFKDVKL